MGVNRLNAVQKATYFLRTYFSHDCENLNARMVMVALESGNSSPLFKLLVEILGLPSKFNKTTWGKHVKIIQDSI